jgi:hypothetical protein
VIFMRSRVLVSLTLALGVASGCGRVKRAIGLGSPGGSRSTSVFGRWVLASPIDSTSFAGATQVDLTLAPGSFTLAAVYPDRAPLNISGRADLTSGGTLTLVPATGVADATAIGFPAGQPLTRLATASGSTLVLAPPTSSVPLPSSVWYRLEAARVAGLAR